MNIEERIASYIQERDACQEAETKAHKRKVELTALIKKLNFALRDLKEILPEESSTAFDLKDKIPSMSRGANTPNQLRDEVSESSAESLQKVSNGLK